MVCSSILCLIVSLPLFFPPSWQREAGARPDTAVVRRMFHGLQPNFWGTDVSPDGRFITQTAFKPDGNLELVELSSGRRYRMTEKESLEDDAYAEAARFSPDGRAIAFVWYDSDRYEIRTVHADGSAGRTVLRSEAGTWDWADLHDWTPDADSLLVSLYSRDEARVRTVLVDTASGDARTLMEFPGSKGPSTAGLSPDGRLIGFGRDGNVFVMRTTGGSPVPLPSGPNDETFLGWGPGGRDILVKRSRSAGDEIWRIQIGAELAIGTPELVKDGLSRIGGVAVRDGRFYYGVTSAGESLLVADVDLEAENMVTRPGPLGVEPLQRSGPPAWSPDGTALAYVTPSGLDAGARLVIHSVNGGQQSELRLPFEVSHLWWHADGSRFLIAPAPGLEPGGWDGLFEVDRRTGRMNRYMASGGVARWAVLSADWTVAYYVEWEGAGGSPGAGHYVKRHDLRTGHVQRIARLDTLPSRLQTVRDTDLSEDGRQMAFRGYSFDLARWTIGTIDTHTGMVRALVSQDPAANDPDVSCRLVTWTPDDASIVYAREITGQDECTLFRIPATGGEAVALGPFPSHRDSWTTVFTPDRARVAFLHGTDVGEVWVVEGIPWTPSP